MKTLLSCQTWFGLLCTGLLWSIVNTNACAQADAADNVEQAKPDSPAVSQRPDPLVATGSPAARDPALAHLRILSKMFERQKITDGQLAEARRVLTMEPRKLASIDLKLRKVYADAADGRLAPEYLDPVLKTFKTFTNSIGMTFVYIPPGEFMMGSPLAEDGRSDREHQHRVRITSGFFLGTHEVTQAQWHAVRGQNPSAFRAALRPVEKVSSKDADEFCLELSTLDGNRYRLPTEAEWEFACRAGTLTVYNTGHGLAALAQAGWYRSDQENTYGLTRRVGQKKPNAWGLYDMHGNVAEWCSDRYGQYPPGLSVDPTGPSNDSQRITRGGSWLYGSAACRSAARGGGTPANRGSYEVGIRLVLVLATAARPEAEAVPSPLRSAVTQPTGAGQAGMTDAAANELARMTDPNDEATANEPQPVPGGLAIDIQVEASRVRSGKFAIVLVLQEKPKDDQGMLWITLTDDTGRSLKINIRPPYGKRTRFVDPQTIDPETMQITAIEFEPGSVGTGIAR